MVASSGQRVARLVHVRDLDRLADPQRARVRLLRAGDEAEQRGLARAVRADDADDAARRQREVEVLEEQVVAVGLGQALRLDDERAEPRARRDDDLELLLLLGDVLP